LHDTLKLEAMGIAAVPVATHEFMAAARAQAAALGRAEFDAVYVRHPIQDQTKAEIEARADLVIDELIARLVITPR
jgi:alkanesulfonate monooxygenase SsuD/methylene tetrahydromethanopterin reductase-like flavin-dependent oxidoreductase (luciferase family)